VKIFRSNGSTIHNTKSLIIQVKQMAIIMPTINIGTYSLRDITTQRSAELQRMLEHCDDFHLLVEGVPTYPYAAEDIFLSVPPGKDPEEKFILGILNAAGDIVGVLEGLPGYPQPDIWWIGLLLLTPETRGKGLGRRVVQRFCERARELGTSAVMLGVVEENQAGLRFWQRLGFSEVSQTEPRPFGNKMHVVHVMRLDLPPSSTG
jgi:ribosomal protein S18 acetylase RimI-like enzyme